MWKKYLVILLLTFLSCDYNEEPLFFVGDSLIHNWDLNACCPTRVTENDGIIGSGIDDWKQTSAYQGRDVVMILGTNDIREDMDVDHYADEYMDMLQNLGARNIFLFSILPRENDKSFDINQIITQVNKSISERVKKFPEIVYMDVYDLFLKDGELNREYTFDGLHINRYGYEILTVKLLMNLK